MARRVFLIDDNELVRQGYAMVIGMTDDLAVCGEALDGAQALERLASAAADVVVVDLGLPDMDGLEVTRRIRKRWPDLHVLVISGHPPEEYAARARSAGADAYVDKKNVDIALLATLREVLAQ